MSATATKTATGPNPKIAAKFRGMAAVIAATVADKRRPRDTNTPKKAMQAVSARIDADHLDRVRTALIVLADAHERGACPPELAAVGTRAALLKMLATRIEHPSYYALVDTGEFYDKTPAAVALRALMDAASDPKAAEARAAARALADLEAKVKFADIPGFFPTPAPVIETMLDQVSLRRGMAFLEPSAGKGDIADAIVAACPEFGRIATFEVSYALREILKAKGHLSVGDDFLAAPVPPTQTERFDCVLMNPPFERGADIDHVRHAVTFLKDGGRLVSVMSVGSFFRSDAKAVAFREWFAAVGGEKIDLPEGAFKDAFRATGTRTVLVVIDRPDWTERA